MVRRSALLVGLTVAAAAVGIGCGDATTEEATAGSSTSAAAASDQPVRLAFFNPVAANAATAAAFEGIKETAAKMNAKVTSFDAGFDQNKQISQMEDATVSGQYDAFVVMPINGAVLVRPTEDAIAKGIKVVANWNNIGPELDSIEPQVPGITAVVAQSLGHEGKIIGNAIVRACEGKNPCKAVYMPGSFKQATETVRMNAAKAVVEEQPHIELKTSAEGGYLADPARKAAIDVLQANPDIDVFATPADQMVVGVLQAIEAAGKTEQIDVIGGSSTTKGVELTRAGKLVSDYVFLPKTQAAKAAELAIRAARGEEVPRSVDSSQMSPLGDELTPEILNTPEGKKFKGEYTG